MPNARHADTWPASSVIDRQSANPAPMPSLVSASWKFRRSGLFTSAWVERVTC